MSYKRVDDVGGVDWKAAAATWPVLHSDSCDAELLIQQAAERLGLVRCFGYLWQEGMTEDCPMWPRTFNKCTVVPDRPVVVALEALQGAQVCLAALQRCIVDFPGWLQAVVQRSMSVLRYMWHQYEADRCHLCLRAQAHGHCQGRGPHSLGGIHPCGSEGCYGYE